ncbi:hypothetical protein X746_27150 [Mesorhizobium sp. LNJC380A00]|nr:hypothetical protein X746_27150 [Mesorhizobium sp. LNJC380A00]ESZ24615.1 hypothetical protein X732_33380 [Mesorhizobium sp. L2C066B000]
MNIGRKILLGGTVSYDDDIELNKRRQHPTIAWLWRLETCDPSEWPELLAKYEDIGRTVMQRATPRQWR